MVIVAISQWQSTPVYAQSNGNNNGSDTKTGNQVFLPLITSQQQVDDSGVFQVFTLDPKSQTITPSEVQAAGVCIRTPFGYRLGKLDDVKSWTKWI